MWRIGEYIFQLNVAVSDVNKTVFQKSVTVHQTLQIPRSTPDMLETTHLAQDHLGVDIFAEANI